MARQSCENCHFLMGSALVFRAFWIKNFGSILFLAFFSDKISVLLEHAAQSVTQERPLKLWNVTWLLRASVRALRALTRALSRDLFLRKMASPASLNKRDAPVIRLSCLEKCVKQDAAKIFNPKFLEHECRAYFMSKKANFGQKWHLSSNWTSHLL